MILHITDNLALGGTASLLLRTLCGLQERGCEVQLCVLGSQSRNYDWEWVPERITYLDLPGDYRRPDQLWQMVRQLRALVRRERPQLLHSWLWLSDYVTALANAPLRLPHVSHIVDRRTWQESRHWKHRFRRWATRRAFTKVGTRFLAVSQAARQFALDTLGLDPQRCDVAWNSIDVEQFTDVPAARFLVASEEGDRCGKWGQEPFVPSTLRAVPAKGSCPHFPLVLGMASRLAPEKGHRYMLDALAQLRQAGRPVRLLMTGGGPYQAELLEYARRLGVNDVAEFVGCVDSVKEFLQCIDVFVVPSIDSEGLPTTILEAMAAGRLVLATNVGGAAEAIDHGVSGLIVPPRDPAALAHAIEQIWTDRPAARSMVAAARTRVHEQFSMNSMLDVILEMYRQQVGGRKLPACVHAG